MRRVHAALDRGGYDVIVGAGAIERAGELLEDRRRIAIVTQEPIREHAERVAAQISGPSVVLTIGTTEAAKTMATVEALCRDLASLGVLRGDTVVAVGGGVVGDTVGFAAGIYHRGIDLVQVPTTLLAQVDAAIGGKTAVNLPEGKNLVGVFHQPIGVLADTTTLTTLPVPEFRTGLGEVAKYALMGDEELRAMLESRAGAVVDGTAPSNVAGLLEEPELLEEIVARCVARKVDVVADDADERTGARATLNYGHTLAHALEQASGFRLAHGEAVAIGLVFAAELARALERVDDREVAAHRRLVQSLGLPTSVPFPVTSTEARAAMSRDKKSTGGLTFVLRGPRGLELVHDPADRALTTALAAVGIES